MPNFNLQPLSEDELNGLQPVERNSAGLDRCSLATRQARAWPTSLGWVSLQHSCSMHWAAEAGPGLHRGSINGLGKLGNALGDWVQNKPVDAATPGRYPTR